MASRAEDLFDKLLAQGEAGLDELIAQGASEELFLDYKRSANDGNSNTIDNRDRANLAKAIEGFGNSEGGVLVWGVGCAKDASGTDVPTTKHPIHEPERFRSWIENAISGLTVPAHGGVRNHAFRSGGAKLGYVVTYVPASPNVPHQTLPEQRYYMRAGSSFVPVPHAVLAGLFGRRPQPRMSHGLTLGTPRRIGKGRVSVEISFMLTNLGPGIAESPFLTLLVRSAPSSPSQLSFSTPDATTWFGQFSLGRKMSIIGKGETKIPPGSWLDPFVLAFEWMEPIDASFHITGSCGAAASPAEHFEIRVEREAIAAALRDFLAAMDRGATPDDARGPIDQLFTS